MDKIKIGQNMKKIRVLRGYTQEKLGEKVNLSANYIGLIERNVNTPSLTAIVDIAQELGISLDFLVGTHNVERRDEQECEKYEKIITQQIGSLNKMQLLYILDIIELLYKYNWSDEKAE